MSNATVPVRDYEDADLAGCLEVFDSNVPDYFRDDERDEYVSFLRELPGPYFVVQEGRTIVGCGGYAVRGSEGMADLCWGMIHKSEHGRGLGRGLTMERLVRACSDPRVHAVALSTSHRTLGFYEKLGFTVLSIEKHGYGPGLDRCAMRLQVRGTADAPREERLE